MTDAGGPGGWDEVVVLVGVRRWDGRVCAAERFAPVLAEHVAVLLVVPDPRPAGRDDDRRLRLVGSRLARLAAPGLTSGRLAVASRLDATLVDRSVRRALVDLGSPRVRAVVLASSRGPVGRIGDEHRVLVVGDDLLDGWAIAERRVAGLERSLVRALGDTDVVLAGSPMLVEVLLDAGVHAELVPDFVDDAAFAPPSVAGPAASSQARPARRRAPVVGCVGDLTGDVDLGVLVALADAGHDLLLVGRGRRGGGTTPFDQLIRRSNVEWVGPRRSSEVAVLVRGCDLGVVPLLDTPYTRARLPLDSLVHLAAGQALVGTACEPVRWLRAGGPVGIGDGLGPSPLLDDRDVAVADGPAHVVELVAERLAQPPDPVAARRRRRFAARHRGAVRAAHLASILGLRDPDALEAAR